MDWTVLKIDFSIQIVDQSNSHIVEIQIVRQLLYKWMMRSFDI